MKKFRNILMIYFLSLCSSCQNNYSEYQVYRTFDEFALKGINHLTETKKPYVRVKTCDDTIDVLIFQKKDEVLAYHYINYGEFWFSQVKEQQKYEPNCSCDTTPHFKEKYIFNDTIMIYKYFMNYLGIKSVESLSFITRKDKLILYFSVPSQNSIVKKFNIFKQYQYNYRKNFNQYDSSIPQSRFYAYYTKKTIGDTLYIFKIEKGAEVLYETRLINQFGEFDPNEGEVL